jgi:DMSO reductase anchor subunit
MIEITRLVLDVGLLVLIWMIQLIVYPSFLFYTAKELIAWHKMYTKAIALIVIPLMLGQLGIAIYQVFLVQNTYTLTSIVLVVFLWGITLLKFAPLHQQISEGNTHLQVQKKLVQMNWMRTIVWTILFVMSAASVILKSL